MTDQNTCHSPNTKDMKLIFRLTENGPPGKLQLIRDVLIDRGWEEFTKEEHEEYEWNLWWRRSQFRTWHFEGVLPWQKLNHFPKTHISITRKDMLVRDMRRMRGAYGASIINFTPDAFNLPHEYSKFVEEYKTCSIRNQQRDQNSSSEEYQVANLWICKPADSSRGRGIFIFKDLNELAYEGAAVVQQYITNPLLIGGYKFDLRIYVLVTTFHPLTIYVYQEGIARFSTEKFDLTSFDNIFAHLTNTSINKTGPSYTSNKDGVGPGCKWTFQYLRNFFEKHGTDYDTIWRKINNIIVLTLLAQASSVPNTTACFELFGFDILIDDNLKPWLLEVNFSPALDLDCDEDHVVKKPMINDLLDILDFKETDAERGGDEYKKLVELKQRAFEKITEKSNPNKLNNVRRVSAQSTKIATQGSNTTPSKLGQKVGAAPTGRVGDFVLIFPFNDVTKKASFASLDMRTIISEIQKQLRRIGRTIGVVSAIKTPATSRTSNVPVKKGVLRNNVYIGDVSTPSQSTPAF